MKERFETPKIELQKTLSTEEVKNEVGWVNQNLKSPFKFEIGKPTKLGIFVTLEDKPESWQLKPEEGHARSAKIGQVVFEDSHGRLYREIDIKGAGYVAFKEKRRDLVGSIAPGERVGFLNFASALHDAQMAETLTNLGVRTHRAVAIITLEEVIDPITQEKISVNEAKQRDLIYENFVPVIEVRAFATKTRLQDISSSKSDSEKKKLIRDIKILIQKELGINKEFSDIDYLNWLAVTTARNIGVMHKNGFLHNYLRAGHNITADGRIVDLDSVRNIKIEYNREPFNPNDPYDTNEIRNSLLLHDFAMEFMSARGAFRDLCESPAFEETLSKDGIGSILSVFDKSYASEFPDAWREVKDRFNLT